YFFFSSRRRHTRFSRDWNSDVCSSDLDAPLVWDARLGPLSGALALPLQPHLAPLSLTHEGCPGPVSLDGDGLVRDSAPELREWTRRARSYEAAIAPAILARTHAACRIAVDCLLPAHLTPVGVSSWWRAHAGPGRAALHHPLASRGDGGGALPRGPGGAGWDRAAALRGPGGSPGLLLLSGHGHRRGHPA